MPALHYLIFYWLDALPESQPTVSLKALKEKIPERHMTACDTNDYIIPGFLNRGRGSQSLPLASSPQVIFTNVSSIPTLCYHHPTYFHFERKRK